MLRRILAPAFALLTLGQGFAIAQQAVDIDVWRTAGPFAAELARPVKVVDSDGRDASPNVSRDGSRIVLSSTRSGTWEVWTCRSDGTDVFQVTRLGDTPVGSTRWSPDGKRIAFDGQKPGHYDLFVVNADGSGLRQLTTESSTDVKPSWSKDGRWIYHTSNRSGEYQVWKIPAAGGQPLQITRRGGYTPFETMDGKFVYYAKGLNEHSLWRVPVSGGEESFVLDNVVSNRWVMLKNGIAILNMDARPLPVIEFYDFSTGRRRPLDALPKEGNIYGGGTAIAAPPGGRWLLFCAIEPAKRPE
jgi:dipeptidyl aminopeptidase/acylaminoacyl peptidase